MGKTRIEGISILTCSGLAENATDVLINIWTSVEN